MKPKAEAALDVLSNALKRRPNLRVRVAGYTDSTGTEDYNIGLSQRRANAVVNGLAARGIHRDRMEAVGFGETNPIADNMTAAGRALNRRVDVMRTGI